MDIFGLHFGAPEAGIVVGLFLVGVIVWNLRPSRMREIGKEFGKGLNKKDE